VFGSVDAEVSTTTSGEPIPASVPRQRSLGARQDERDPVFTLSPTSARQSKTETVAFRQAQGAWSERTMCAAKVRNVRAPNHEKQACSLVVLLTHGDLFKLLRFAVMALNKAGDRYQAIHREVPSDTGPPPERAQGQPYRRTHRELGHELYSSHSSICRERRQGDRRVPAIRTRDETAGARAEDGPNGSTRDQT